MEAYKQTIRQYIRTHEREAVALLQRLTAERSVSGAEKRAQQIVIEQLQDMNLEVDVWEPAREELEHHPYFISARPDFHGSPNVVGILRGVGGGRSMIVNGHIDVVPEGERKQWTQDPYGGKVENGRVYGRGTTDMKGGNTALLLALEAIRHSGISLKGDVYFQSVIEEESGGAGTLSAILRGYKADGVIIPEPTNMKLFVKQQGSMWFRAKVKGRVAHGGTRYEGVSAIEKSMLVLEHIRDLEQLRNSRIMDPLYAGIPIPIPINVGTIQGGTWPSSVADLVILEGRFGVAPHERMEDAQQEFMEWLQALSLQDEWFAAHPVEVEWFGARWVPGSIEAEHELVQMLRRNFQLVAAQEPIMEAAPWGTDGGLFTQIANIPMIVFGPGETKVAHYPDEYIEIEKLLLAAEIIACTLLDWCGVHLEEEHGGK
ncbi:peptidase [Ectobacillus ponti]|uniref:Peptidase n=1 Tax=Ectobacillus ponti TaxID=2961894 RepID=A0AA41X8P1_9BACI|nr:peptidase [Ectobacillus ponti]MCP8970762.1 peptidase [Ectobacillus ponti]